MLPLYITTVPLSLWIKIIIIPLTDIAIVISPLLDESSSQWLRTHGVMQNYAEGEG